MDLWRHEAIKAFSHKDSKWIFLELIFYVSNNTFPQISLGYFFCPRFLWYPIIFPYLMWIWDNKKKSINATYVYGVRFIIWLSIHLPSFLLWFGNMNGTPKYLRPISENVLAIWYLALRRNRVDAFMIDYSILRYVS